MSDASGSEGSFPPAPEEEEAGEPSYVPLISPPASVYITDTFKRADLKGKEYTAYRMQVTRVDGEVNTLDQRYQFFSDLHDELTKASLVPEGATLPGKKWFSNFDAAFVSERRRGLQEYLEACLASRAVQYSAEIEKFFDAPGRYDWPSKLGAVDLDVHDCPHLSSATETWRFSAHVTIDAKDYSVFACFSRSVSEVDPETKKASYVHTVVSAIIDVEAGTYHAATVLDQHAPAVLRDRLARTTFRDQTIVAAYQEILAKGSLPLPDRLAETAAGGSCDPRRLKFVMDGNKLERQSDGGYSLTIRHPSGRGCNLFFKPAKPPVRHGAQGIVKGDDGEEMYSYFIPRCDVGGSLVLEPGGSSANVEATDSGWFEHQFGGRPLDEAEQAPATDARGYAVNACHLQLDGGMDVTLSLTFDMTSGAVIDGSAVVVDAEGGRTWYDGDSVLFEGSQTWRSTRTFQEFPTSWHVSVPEAELDLQLNASFDDQELITLLSQPSFWEGRVSASGECAGRDVSGVGFLQRRGFGALCSLDQFFLTVGNVVRLKAAELLPDGPSAKQARKIVGGSAETLEGLRLGALDTAIVQPIRKLTDCGGPAWRTFGMLAACDAVGGDSRALSDWIALPELLHVGSTLLGGASGPHEVNAGCMCSSIAQRLLERVRLPAEMRCELYDCYFTALRASQAGQGLEIEGLMGTLPKIVGDGDTEELEEALLCTYRLKTAVPAGALAQMGALAGEGEEEHCQALGEFFSLTALGFQLASDVSAIRRGEPSALQCVTMPVVKALGKCKTRPERQQIVDALRGTGGGAALGRERLCPLVEAAGVRPASPTSLLSHIPHFIHAPNRASALLSGQGFPACMAMAIGLVEEAWRRIASPAILPDSYHKIMLRAFALHLVQ